MREIPLTRGMVALVDDEWYPYLSQFKWHASAYRKKTSFRAKTNVKSSDGKKQITLLMHREIMSPSVGEEVDHIDHNPLNNQTSNLRICSGSQNNMNTRKRSGCCSEYKGVTWNKGALKWRCCISFNKKFIHLGLFTDEKEAALAYNKKATELFGEFACLNVIRD